MKKQVKQMLLLELGILFLVLIIFIVVKYKIFTIMPTCIINKYLGILCPSCGGTRCVVNFALGNFKESFLYHPLFFITIIYFIFINFVYIINSFRNKKIFTFLYPKTKFWIVWITLLIIFTIIRNIVKY